MNNNRSDERAIQAGCKGVFSTASYIGIGSKGYGTKLAKPVHVLASRLGAQSARYLYLGI